MAGSNVYDERFGRSDIQSETDSCIGNILGCLTLRLLLEKQTSRRGIREQMVKAAHSHCNSREVTSVLSASWKEIGYLIEGDCWKGKCGVKHGNSHSLNEKPKKKLLLYVRIL
ncbi:hypothetical protein EVAR_46035_1 [Eumeta japonica]|uniref:Uncharacterized protein n=1 Tax=Eumeta variegata TaxID=151549 RepID=A0A4C1XDR8_EUMVA|nr:hypothetical protein EVAR_46035_1 [Eumeta japonica]